MPEVFERDGTIGGKISGGGTKMVNARDRIKKAMTENEKFILRMIQERGAYSPVVPSIAGWNAIERLCDRKVIRWDRKECGYVRA
jgi:hypothetical protein